jgi:hypothetical protein
MLPACCAQAASLAGFLAIPGKQQLVGAGADGTAAAAILSRLVDAGRRLADR